VLTGDDLAAWIAGLNDLFALVVAGFTGSSRGGGPMRACVAC
jgi:hypothetical protein